MQTHTLLVTLPGIALVAAFAASVGCRSAIEPGRGSERSTLPIVWRVPSNSRAPGLLPFEPTTNAAEDRVYFPTADFRLKKLDASDGRVIWDVDLGPVFTIFPGWNAALAGPNVIVAKVDLFAFDTASGAPRWYFQLPEKDEIGYSTIATDGASIYAASRRARMVALDGTTGVVRWNVDLSGGTADVGALFPILDGDQIYVCTRNTQTVPLRGTLWALDTRTGAERWHHDFLPEQSQSPASCFGDAALASGLVVQPQADGRVFAFDRATGEVRWTAPRVHDLARSQGDMRWAVARGNVLVVTSTTGTLVSLDPATGTQRWRTMPFGPGAFDRTPALSDESIYLYGGAYYGAVDVATGALQWRDPSTDDYTGNGTQLRGRALVSRDRVFIGGRDASYALRRWK